jgi:polysaccharide export outer membrane protein
VPSYPGPSYPSGSSSSGSFASGTFPSGAGPLPRMDAGEPISNTEAFFAARLPEQQPPLRQFGYDTF